MANRLKDINSPADLKNLDIQALEELAGEIREFLISVISKTGGHLAPSLGAVELTLALHTVFDTPKDKIVWDVGHQAYVHKILTGRREQFLTLRQYGGICGFPKISESEYDTFGVGHASTAISAALGMASARDLTGEDYRVVAVVGDGAMTGGLSFEGLNNAGCSRQDIIVVMNDNSMSISPNVGALSRAFTQVITNPLYNRIKADIWELTGKLPRGSNKLRGTVHRIEEGLKAMLVPASLFEHLGFRYFGLIDGHSITQLCRIFQEIKRLHGPILVHVITKKGKGYKFAEDDATKFHGLGSFCPETGCSEPKAGPTYTDIFGNTLIELAEKDKKIVGITAAMSHGTGMIHFARRFPERFFDVGIAEQHAVTFAAGLALRGLKPVVAIYSTFLQRAFDQIIHDVALQKIPMVLVLDRGGLVGEDGPTHHGAFDLSYLRLVPNTILMTPKDEDELRNMLWTALQHKEGPVAIRYPRGYAQGVPLSRTFRKIPIGKSEILREGTHLAILAVGDQVYRALELSKSLEEKGVSARVVNMRFVKPLDIQMVRETAEKYPLVVSLENNTVIGGFGSALAEVISESGYAPVFKRFGLPDRFIPHGVMCDLWKDTGLTLESLRSEIMDLVRKNLIAGQRHSRRA